MDKNLIEETKEKAESAFRTAEDWAEDVIDEMEHEAYWQYSKARDGLRELGERLEGPNSK